MLDYIVDLTIVAVILFFAITGYISGFTGKVLSFITWVGSVAIAYFIYPHLTPLLGNSFSSDFIRNGIAFAGVFILFLIIFSILSSFISSSIKKTKMGSADRNLGLIIGILIGLFFLLISATSLRFFVDLENNRPEAFSKSKLFPYVELCLDHICHFLPGTLNLRPTHGTQANEINKRAAETLSRYQTEAEEKAYTSQDRSALDSLVQKLNN